MDFCEFGEMCKTMFDLNKSKPFRESCKDLTSGVCVIYQNEYLVHFFLWSQVVKHVMWKKSNMFSCSTHVCFAQYWNIQNFIIKYSVKRMRLLMDFDQKGFCKNLPKAQCWCYRLSERITDKKPFSTRKSQNPFELLPNQPPLPLNQLKVSIHVESSRCCWDELNECIFFLFTKSYFSSKGKSQRFFISVWSFSSLFHGGEILNWILPWIRNLSKNFLVLGFHIWWFGKKYDEWFEVCKLITMHES